MRLRRYALGDMKRELLCAEWPAARLVLMLPIETQELVLKQGLVVVKRRPDGTFYSVRKDVRKLTKSETAQVMVEQ